MESRGFWSKAKYYVAITAAALGIGTYVGTTYKSEVDDARDKTVEAVGKTFHAANECKPDWWKKADKEIGEKSSSIIKKVVEAQRTVYDYLLPDEIKCERENKEVAQKTTDGGEQ